MKVRYLVVSLAVAATAASLFFTGCGSSGSGDGGGNNVPNAPAVTTSSPVVISTVEGGATAGVAATAVGNGMEGEGAVLTMAFSQGQGAALPKATRKVVTAGKVAAATTPLDYDKLFCPDGGKANYSTSVNGTSFNFQDCRNNSGSGYSMTNGSLSVSVSGLTQITFSANVDMTTTEYDTASKATTRSVEKMTISDGSTDAVGSTFKGTISGTISVEDMLKNEKHDSSMQSLVTEYNAATLETRLSSGAIGARKFEAGVLKQDKAVGFKDFVVKGGTSGTTINGAFALSSSPDSCKANGTYIVETITPVNVNNTAGELRINTATNVKYNANGTVTVSVPGGLSKTYASLADFKGVCPDFDTSSAF